MLQKLLSAGRWSANATDWASLILRITLGCLMLHHGIPKFNKMLSGDMGFADPIGIGEPVSLVLTVFAEFVCSILLIVGLGTRLATIPLIITMLVVIFIVHAPDGMDEKEHGLLFLLPYCALFLLGAGKFSIDFYLKKGE